MSNKNINNFNYIFSLIKRRRIEFELKLEELLLLLLFG